MEVDAVVGCCLVVRSLVGKFNFEEAHISCAIVAARALSLIFLAMMDDYFDSNSRDSRGKRRNNEAAAAHDSSSNNNNESSYNVGVVKDDGLKMSASAAAYESREGDNNNEIEANNDDAPFSSGFHSTVDLKPPAKQMDDQRGRQDDYNPSPAARSDTEDEDRKISSTFATQHPSSTTQRGRSPLQRNQDIDVGFPSTASDNGFVPLKVIHVVRRERAPSVPDLTSLQHYPSNYDTTDYNNHHHRHHPNDRSNITQPPPLSDVILKIKERGGDQKQQFEERLRRAHLRLVSSDASSGSNVIRYRSKSTPSHHRGGGGNNNGESSMTWGDYNNYQHRMEERRRQSDSGRHDDGSENEQQVSLDEMNRNERQHSPTPSGEMHSHDVQRSVAVGNAIGTTTSSVKSSGISVAAGSHRSHVSFDDRNTIPEPPPRPPPTTERERLVERERQARLETERARRRHIALQRDRQLEEHNDDDNDGDSFDNDGSDRDALIGQMSFEDGNGGITSPPIPPPLATEKERLVERERQARLETERARRRHMAFQREQQLEIDEQQIGDDDNDSHDYPDAMPDNRFNNIDEVLVEALPESFVSPIAASRDNNLGSREASTESVVSSDTEHGSGAKAIAQNNDAEATNLSYPMERFLETLGDETANAPNVEIPPTVENDESSLPYTMELFLAENAAAGVSGDGRTDNETTIGHHSDSNILASSTSLDLPQPPSSALSTGGVSDRVVSENIMTSDFDEAVGLTTERPVHSDTLGRSLRDNESLSLSDQHSHPPSSPSQPLDDSTLDSPELTTSRPSRPITEADIAQLAEVEHASIGNAAPQSERDEPSEASIPRRTLLDQAFSVATQTTVIDSVTETSVGRSHLMSEANQSRDSSTIIRVGGSVETGSSGGASSASIEAVPSNVSDEDSDDDSHMIINPLSTRSDSHAQSLADGSDLSPDANLRMPELTEADVVALAEMDYASIGNAPPLSVRDERLSESSVTERGGRQFSVATPISEMDSIDENSILRGSPFRSIIDEDSESNLSIPEQDSRMSNESENTSVEVMPSDRSANTGSHNSIEVMLSEHEDDSLHDRRRSVTDTGDMVSSTSIDASPSVGLENNLDNVNGSRNHLAMYGATSEADGAAEYYNALNIFNYDHDEESALIPPQPSPSRADSSHMHRGDKSTRAGKNCLYGVFASVSTCM